MYKLSDLIKITNVKDKDKVQTSFIEFKSYNPTDLNKYIKELRVLKIDTVLNKVNNSIKINELLEIIQSLKNGCGIVKPTMTSKVITLDEHIQVETDKQDLSENYFNSFLYEKVMEKIYEYSSKNSITININDDNFELKIHYSILHFINMNSYHCTKYYVMFPVTLYKTFEEKYSNSYKVMVNTKSDNKIIIGVLPHENDNRTPFQLFVSDIFSNKVVTTSFNEKVINTIRYKIDTLSDSIGNYYKEIVLNYEK